MIKFPYLSHLTNSNNFCGFYLRFYGNRMDLLTFMIQGPNKTPYEDSLFVFDAQLSKDYPNSPPNVHYVSFIPEQINPNLYNDGTICISLLETFSGEGCEVWSPNSTLLQLIVSIQGRQIYPNLISVVIP